MCIVCAERRRSFRCESDHCGETALHDMACIQQYKIDV
nr:MAG TPA: hypothetical protein [Caudoviricetes sp.]